MNWAVQLVVARCEGRVANWLRCDYEAGGLAWEDGPPPADWLARAGFHLWQGLLLCESCYWHAQRKVRPLTGGGPGGPRR